jgi:hypothetical protein
MAPAISSACVSSAKWPQSTPVPAGSVFGFWVIRDRSAALRSSSRHSFRSRPSRKQPRLWCDRPLKPIRPSSAIPSGRDAELLLEMHEQVPDEDWIRSGLLTDDEFLGKAAERTGVDLYTKTGPGDLRTVYRAMVSPGYFSAMGIPLKRGRDFTNADGKTSPVVIVTEKLARQRSLGRRRHWTAAPD